jgi:hypothetical protein
VSPQKIKIPYNSFPDISKKFIDEFCVRTDLCLKALIVLSNYKKKEHKTSSEFHEIELIKYITARFIVIELFALLDGNSDLSIYFHKNEKRTKIFIQPTKLKKLFPSLSERMFSILYKRLQLTINKHKDLLFKLDWTRNNKLAHAGISWFEKTKNEISPGRFPVQETIDLITELQKIFSDVSFVGLIQRKKY